MKSKNPTAYPALKVRGGKFPWRQDPKITDRERTSAQRVWVLSSDNKTWKPGIGKGKAYCPKGWAPIKHPDAPTAKTKKAKKPSKATNRFTEPSVKKKLATLMNIVVPISDSLSDRFTKFVLDEIQRDYGLTIKPDHKSVMKAQKILAELDSINRNRIVKLTELELLAIDKRMAKRK